VQLAANNATLFEAAVKILSPYCDGLDLNLGCPQHIARKGGYGAFLMNSDWSIISSIISAGAAHAPITVKIRVFESIAKTVEYAREIERSGASALTVHGRRIDQKKAETGIASWSHILAVKAAVDIPVISNGNIRYFEG